MWGFLLRICIFIIFINIKLVFSKKFQWEDEDTIITEATREEDIANVVYERQDIPVHSKKIGHGTEIRSRAEKRTCYSSLGDQGMCSTFKACFPMLYYTDDEHMGEVKHPVLAELLMSTSGPCDPLPFAFRRSDDFPGEITPSFGDTSGLICCPSMKVQEPTIRPVIAKKATIATSTTTGKPRPTKPWEYVPDMMVGQMVHMEVVPPKINVDNFAMRPMGNQFGKSTTEKLKEIEKTTTGPPKAVDIVTAILPSFIPDESINITTNPSSVVDIVTTINPPFISDESIATTISPVGASETEAPTTEFSQIVENTEIEVLPSHIVKTEPPPLKLMNPPCGYLNSSKDPSQPWVAAIKLDSKYICTGSVIDSYHVLTAAHCIAHLSSLDVGKLRIYLGEKILNSNLDGPMVIRKVYRTMHHRGYSMSTLENDIGLLKLNLPIPIKTSRVKPICLPSEEDENYEGMEASIVGWGPRWNDIPSDHILENRFRVWPNNGCSNAYKRLTPDINITETMMCAQYYHIKPKEMSSFYDIDTGGSPVIIKSKDDTNIQVGIYSWRLRTSSTYPYVLTRVSKFPKWIQKNRLRK